MPSFAISAAVIERLGWVLLHSFWQFALVALAAAALQRLQRRSTAAAHYVALLITFSAIVLAPAVTWFVVPQPEPLSASSADLAKNDSISMRPRLPMSAQGTLVPSPAPSVEVPAPDLSQRESLTPREIGWSFIETFVRPWLNTIVAIWCCGVFAFAWRPVLGWYTVRRLRRVGVDCVSAGIDELLHRTAKRLAVRRAVQVVQSTLVRVPLVVGCLRPVILLPVSIVSGLPAEQLEAILAHELAHIRRHDYLVNLLQTLVETVFFYHPAVWWLSRQIRNERENCCDDLAVAVVGNCLDYGQALLAVEELRAAPLALAVGATGGSLVTRVRRLLKTEAAPGRPSSSWSMGSAVASLALAIGLAVGVGTILSDHFSRESVAAEGKKSDTTDAAPSLDIVIAEDVLLRDGKIVTWDQVVEDWRAIRKQQGKPIHPRLHLTSGAIKAGLWERYQTSTRQVEQELSEAKGLSLRWMSLRAALRYDAIQTSADLNEKPEQVRTGIVLNAARRAVPGATVVLLPEDSPHVPIMLQRNLSLRNPLDEVWTRTDSEGRFRIAAPDSGYRLAALTPNGFALATVPKAGEQAELTLLPLAEVEVSSAGKNPQSLSFQLDLPSLPDSCWGFAVHGVSIGEQSTTIRLPPGRLSISRELDVFRGMKNIVLAEQFILKAGEKKNLSLAAPGTEADAKIEGSIRWRWPDNSNPAQLSEKALKSLEKPTNVEWLGLALDDSLTYLSDYHEIGIRVDKDALKAVGVALDMPLTLKLDGASLHSVLTLMLEPLQLGYFVDAKGLVITTRELALEEPKPESKGDEQGSDMLRRIRRESEPLLAAMAKDHGYSLAKGQDVCRVAPPFAPLRMTYYRTGHPSQSEAIPRGPSAMLFRWQNDRLQSWGMTFGGGADDGYSLDGVLDALLQIKSHRIEGPPELRNKTVPGDWIVRIGASEDRVVEQLEAILRKEFMLPVRLSFRDIKRDVYVASGKYNHQPLPGRPAKSKLILTDKTLTTDPVDVYGKELVPDSGAGGGTGEFPEFLDWLGRWIGIPIVSDVESLPANQLSWRLHEHSLMTEQSHREDHDPKLVLANITAQTGLKFRPDFRPLKILVIERE